jgi:hypothetical protein
MFKYGLRISGRYTRQPGGLRESSALFASRHGQKGLSLSRGAGVGDGVMYLSVVPACVTHTRYVKLKRRTGARGGVSGEWKIVLEHKERTARWLVLNDLDKHCFRTRTRVCRGLCSSVDALPLTASSI